MMKMIITTMLLLFITQAQAGELKILTWNVFMLPKPIKFSLQDERADLMVKEFEKGKYDVIVLQEAFDWKFQARLRRNLSKVYPHQDYLSRKVFSFTVYGSGVYYLSKYPFKKLGHIHYTKCATADCLASKGSSVIELLLPYNKKIHIASTHMQSGGSEKSVNVRLDQLGQLKGLFARTSQQNIPLIFLGDFNINALKGSEYPRALALLGMTSTPLEGDLGYTNGFPTLCYKKPGSDEKEWIDHIFVKGPAAIKGKQVVPFFGDIKGKKCALSDHWGVEGVLTF